MKLGIVGLPNVGKSTLFNSLTKAKAEAANYPFCTINPNVGIVPVPDIRLDTLSDIFASKKTVPAVIEFVDIAGLVKGASKGEGLGNQFLSNIREVDAIVHVVRCFDDDNIVHVDGSISPIRDVETINLELIFSDLEILDRRISKASHGARNNKDLALELALLQRLKQHLESNKLAINFEATEEEAKIISEINLLTSKPVIYAANVSEDELGEEALDRNSRFIELNNYSIEHDSKIFAISAKLEEELSELNEDEKQDFLSDLNIKYSGLQNLIKASYSILGLISFLTAGEQETRAWTIQKGSKAPQAAGKIHTDFEKGFIKAEVIDYDDLVRLRSFSKAKEEGVVRLEGKEYIVKDGDVIVFRFNV